LGYSLGVDVGTTYTAAATSRDGHAEIAGLGSRNAAIPTILYLAAGTVVVGEAARRREQTDPDRVVREFKRRLGDSVPIFVDGSPRSAESLLALVVRWVVDKVSEQEGEPPGQIVLTHPANWGPYRRELFDQAISMAGISPTSTISEPEAAAVYYASTERIEPGELVAVYDLGGGTFDAALLRRTDTSFEIVGTPEGIEHLGGLDVDEAVLEHVKRSLALDSTSLDAGDPAVVRALRHLRAECGEAKEALSFDATATVSVLLPGVHSDVVIRRHELERMIRPLVDETITLLERALASAGASPGDLRSVLLVGGSSRIPLIAEMISARLGRPVSVDVHPKHAIALGAAITAAAGAGGSAAAPPAEPPRRRRRRRRTLLLGAAAAVAVGGIVAALLAVAGGDGDGGSVATAAGDLWAATVSAQGAVVKIDGTTGTVTNSLPLDGIAEEAVVTENYVWVATLDGGAVLHELDRTDGTLRRDVPLNVAGAASVEVVPNGDGAWVLAVPNDGPATVLRVDSGGQVRARTDVVAALIRAEPVTDGGRLFVATATGAVRVDPDGATSPGTVEGGQATGALALANGSLYLVRNDAVHEFDPDTMSLGASHRYAVDRVERPLIDDPTGSGVQIEEAYASGRELTFVASDAVMDEGAFFFRVDGGTGQVLARTKLSSVQQAGTFDLRQTGDATFWAYLSTGDAAVLRLDAVGNTNPIPLPARGGDDPDLVVNGDRVIVSDVDPDGNPVIYVVDPASDALEFTVHVPA
jgi:actin-like ATPase involved in cell morphogenesis